MSSKSSCFSGFFRKNFIDSEVFITSGFIFRSYEETGTIYCTWMKEIPYFPLFLPLSLFYLSLSLPPPLSTLLFLSLSFSLCLSLKSQFLTFETPRQTEAPGGCGCKELFFSSICPTSACSNSLQENDECTLRCTQGVLYVGT